jgi:hypothetical protein
VGPRLIDSEHAPEPQSDKEELEDDEGRDEENGGDADDELSPLDERSGLLFPGTETSVDCSGVVLSVEEAVGCTHYSV